MRLSIRPLAAALLVASSGCELGNIIMSEQTTVTLRIQGRVTSETDVAPVVGTVSLGIGGHFSFPVVQASAQTDALGRYSIVHTATHEVGGCPFWLQAEAGGYQTSSIEDSRNAVRCINESQTVNIQLQPRP